MKKNISNSMVFGVCSGIADSLDIDVTLIRAGFALATIFGIGTPIIVYIVLAVLMPSK